jgi:hypothetical protein
MQHKKDQHEGKCSRTVQEILLFVEIIDYIKGTTFIYLDAFGIISQKDCIINQDSKKKFDQMEALIPTSIKTQNRWSSL